MSLEHYRKRAGLSQSELASESGVSQSQISHIEKFRRKPSSMALGACRAIVRVLNDRGAECSIDDVFPDKAA